MRASMIVRASLGAALAGGVAVMALWPETIDVDTATVERAAMQVSIDEDGETRVRDRFVISAPVSGRLSRIEIEPGDTLTRGAVVAELSPAGAPTWAGSASRSAYWPRARTKRRSGPSSKTWFDSASPAVGFGTTSTPSGASCDSIATATFAADEESEE